MKAPVAPPHTPFRGVEDVPADFRDFLTGTFEDVRKAIHDVFKQAGKDGFGVLGWRITTLNRPRPGESGTAMNGSCRVRDGNHA